MYIALGITGCIGAYKAIELVRLFQKAGHDVQAVTTRHALEFVTPLVLETITRHPVISDMFAAAGAWDVEHIALARRADVLCVAPATANIMAKFARGIADDFLSTLYLSNLNPVVVAPAMNYAMWQHPATRENVEILRQRGVRIVEPGSGYLACGEEGAGRLADLAVIAEAVIAAGTPSRLSGRTILVTAGPTAEDIDPVRFVTNRSTGRMGFAVARMAARRGARVILVTGPTMESLSFECEREDVRSAEEMARAVERRLPEADALIMAAAVADYRPIHPSAAKIKKSDGVLTLELERTRDILGTIAPVRRPDQVVVAFAAETENLLESARGKMKRKNADLMVANQVGPGQGFGTDTNTVTILSGDGRTIQLDDRPKDEIGGVILDEVERLFKERIHE